ncbi:hypothetical protein BDW75DRAFT_199372 [Aspergillus navahoensis]
MISANSARSIDDRNYLHVIATIPEPSPFSDQSATSCFSIQCQFHEVILNVGGL